MTLARTLSAVAIGNSYVPEPARHVLHEPRGRARPPAAARARAQHLAHAQRALAHREAVQPAPRQGQVQQLALQHVQDGRGARQAAERQCALPYRCAQVSHFMDFMRIL